MLPDALEFVAEEGFDAVADALPFAIDPGKITVEPGLSYCISPIKAHDYAAGVMAAFVQSSNTLGRCEACLPKG